MILDPALPVRPEPPPLAPGSLRLMQHLMYGWLPPALPLAGIDTVLPEAPCCDGLGLRSLLRLHVVHGDGRWQGDLLVVRPAAARAPVPVLAGLNFKGLHSVCDDPAIPMSPHWVHEPGPRGGAAGRWDFAQALRAGVAVATMGLADIHLDNTDAALLDASHGVGRLFGRFRHAERGAHAWGAIAAWAWGVHRIVDALQAQPWADPARLGVIGHSRLGKTALLAAATDPRLALCIDNQSGTCGGALSRKEPGGPGETLARICATFPHWFCPALAPLAATPERLPFDQHHLLAAIAPRPLLMNYAAEDVWADPPSSFRCARLAEPAWGSAALPTAYPEPSRTVGERLAWRVRPGPHSVTAEDWTAYLGFCARWWRLSPT